MTKAEYKAALLKLDPEVREGVEWAVDRNSPCGAQVPLKDLLMFQERQFIAWANDAFGPRK